MSRVPPIVLLFSAAANVLFGQTSTLPLTLDDATRRALERNTTLAVERRTWAGWFRVRAPRSVRRALERGIGWRRNGPGQLGVSGRGERLLRRSRARPHTRSRGSCRRRHGSLSATRIGRRPTAYSRSLPPTRPTSEPSGSVLRTLRCPAREAIRVAWQESASEARLTDVWTR